MTRLFSLLAAMSVSFNTFGAIYTNVLDPAHKIQVETVAAGSSSTVTFEGKVYKLDGNTIYLDGELSDQQAAASPFIYNNVQDALEALNVGPESTTTKTLLIAPGVYWIDNGMFVDCPFISLTGLTTNPEYVILSSNQCEGQDADDECSMLYLISEEITAANITFGNYCNTDLIYPLKEQYNRKKRTESEVPVHVVHNNAYKVKVENCLFVGCTMDGVQKQE